MRNALAAPATACPHTVPETVQLAWDDTVYCTLSVQLPLGLAPKLMPPVSLKVIGKTGASFAKLICVDAVTLGLPLMVTFDDERHRYGTRTVSTERCLSATIQSRLHRVRGSYQRGT